MVLDTCGIENPRWCVWGGGGGACDGGVVVVVVGGGGDEENTRQHSKGRVLWW